VVVTERLRCLTKEGAPIGGNMRIKILIERLAPTACAE